MYYVSVYCVVVVLATSNMPSALSQSDNVMYG